jgi:hypothetical protein
MDMADFYFLPHKFDQLYIFWSGLIISLSSRIYLLLPVEIDGFGRQVAPSSIFNVS